MCQEQDKNFHVLSPLTLSKSFEVDSIPFTTSQMRKWRLRHIKQLAQLLVALLGFKLGSLILEQQL